MQISSVDWAYDSVYFEDMRYYDRLIQVWDAALKFWAKANSEEDLVTVLLLVKTLNARVSGPARSS